MGHVGVGGVGHEGVRVVGCVMQGWGGVGDVGVGWSGSCRGGVGWVTAKENMNTKCTFIMTIKN